MLVRVEATEQKWASKARRPGYIIGLLNEHRASWALIHQWAGHDAAVAGRPTAGNSAGFLEGNSAGVNGKCTNPPRGVRLPRPASGYTDLIPAVAKVAFDGRFPLPLLA